jgi:cystathionine beta-lyase/cystathionine gamma-synthase
LAGQEPDPTTGAVVVPISLATTFLQDSPGVHKVPTPTAPYFLFIYLFIRSLRKNRDYAFLFLF